MGYKEAKLKSPVEVVRDVPLLPRKRTLRRGLMHVPMQGSAAEILAPWEDDISPTPTVISPRGKEGSVQQAKNARVKVTRKVEWRSANGRLVVVAGPFPPGFFRTDTRSTVAKASRMGSADMWAHEGTTKEDAFAKCMAEDVVEILGGENEFGTVIP
jgi:hypothetical protein